MWQETIAFIKRAEFDDVHLFRFSARPNTLAASLPNPVPPDIKRKRWNEAETLIETIKSQRLAHTIGTPLRVLWEQALDTEGDLTRWQGYSENYLRIIRKFPKDINMRGVVTAELFINDDIALNVSDAQG